MQILPPGTSGELRQQLALDDPHLPHVVPASVKISVSCEERVTRTARGEPRNEPWRRTSRVRVRVRGVGRTGMCAPRVCSTRCRATAHPRCASTAAKTSQCPRPSRTRRRRGRREPRVCSTRCRATAHPRCASTAAKTSQCPRPSRTRRRRGRRLPLEAGPQSHGAPSMSFDFRQSFTCLARGADAVGGSLFGPALHAQPRAVREPRRAHIWLASAPAIPQSAQFPRVAPSCEGTCRTRQ